MMIRGQTYLSVYPHRERDTGNGSHNGPNRFFSPMANPTPEIMPEEAALQVQL